MADLPERPRAETREQLGFEPQGMVRWFDPVQLAGTAVQVVVSSLFGAYSDVDGGTAPTPEAAAADDAVRAAGKAASSRKPTALGRLKALVGRR